MKKCLLILITLLSSFFAQAQIVKVNAAATGANDGTSWADAYTDLQTALTNTSSGQIWVVAGTYYPGTTGNTAASFPLKNNVQILGGFNGTEGGPAQRNPAVNVTILSGDLNQSAAFDGSDAYHVVISYNEDSTAVLDGFTITGGNAVGGNIWDLGGGGFSHQPTGSGALNPIIRNCIFTGNNANNGSAIAVVNWYVPSSNVRTQIINCKLINDVNITGGVIFTECQGTGSYVSSKFENVLIANNTSASGTTALWIEHVNGGRSDVQFIGCTIANNTTSGNAIYYRTYGGPGTLNFKNCILQDASVFTDGVLYADNSNVNSLGGFSGSNNISSNPLFVNPAIGDFHLQCASPSINFGENSFTIEAFDLDNNNRINGNVDMGVYESNYTLPNVTALATLYSVCMGTTTQLYGSGADTYTWTGGVLDNAPFSPSFTDTYTVTGTDANGCVNTSTLTITVNPLPPIVANSSNSGICVGSSITLYGTGGFPGAYTWTNGVNDNVSFAPISTQTYTVIGIDGNGCQAIDQITVTVDDTVGFDAGSNMDVCRTGTPFVTLSGNNVGHPFTWTTLGTGSWVNGSSLTPDYYLSGADASGANVAIVFQITPTYCPSLSDTLLLTMQDPTSAFAGADTSLCSGTASGSLVTASTTNSSFITWSTNGAGSFSSAISPTAFYTFSPADNAGGIINIGLESIPSNAACPHAFDTLSITIHPIPTFNLGPDYTICETDSISLQTNVTGGTPPYIFNWGNGLGTISTANFENYLPLVTENINLYLSDQYGCVATDTVLVTLDASETLTINMHVGAGILTHGTMYMLRFIPQQAAFDTMFPYPFSGGTGTISFNGFPHGNYLIKIVPDTLLYPNLLPTYYGDAFQWDSATVINHSCFGPFTADINMIALLGGTGSGSVSGFVIEDVGFGLRYGSNNNHVMVPGGPLKGIDVKLGKNPGGGIQARTTSGDDGKYEFTNVPNDNYRIYVDIPGLPMDSNYTLTVDATNLVFTDLNYYADSNSVYPILPTAVGLNQHSKTSISTFEIYPNPASRKTNLVFSSEKQNHASIKVLDITGKQIMNITLTNLPKGKHEYQLNFGNQQLQSGIYFIELINEDGKQIKKLIVE